MRRKNRPPGFDPRCGKQVRLFKNESAAMGTASDGALREELSESEIKELGTIDGLISVADAEKILKKLPYVKFNSSLKLQTSRLNKNSDGEYFYRLYYSNDDTNINTTINAHNGKILSLSNSAGWNYDEKELNDSAKQSADKKTYEFLNAVAPEEMQTVGEAETEYNGSLVTKNYARLVNGIKYVNNGIRVAINAKKNVITNYLLNGKKNKRICSRLTTLIPKMRRPLGLSKSVC